MKFFSSNWVTVEQFSLMSALVENKIKKIHTSRIVAVQKQTLPTLITCMRKNKFSTSHMPAASAHQ